MGLEISICVDDEAKDSIVVNETTGKVGGSNLGGWGGTNGQLTNVAAAQFEFFPPEKTQALIVKVYPDFPTDDITLGYEVLASALGFNEFESGVWRAVYRVTMNDGTEHESEEISFTLTSAAQCCVDKSLSQINQSNLGSARARKILELSGLLRVARWAGCECGNFNVAQSILKYINLQCNCSV